MKVSLGANSTICRFYTYNGAKDVLHYRPMSQVPAYISYSQVALTRLKEVVQTLVSPKSLSHYFWAKLTFYLISHVQPKFTWRA